MLKRAAAASRESGMRAQVDVGVAQQRQDRVVERRRRDLDLAARRPRRRYSGMTAFSSSSSTVAQERLVVLREAASLRDQRLGRARRRPGRTDRSTPACARPAGRAGRRAETAPPRPRRSPAPETSPRRASSSRVPRVDVDHALPLRVEEVLEDEADVVRVERRRPASGPARDTDRGRGPAANASSCTSSDGTRLNVTRTSGNSRSSATMP